MRLDGLEEELLKWHKGPVVNEAYDAIQSALPTLENTLQALQNSMQLALLQSVEAYFLQDSAEALSDSIHESDPWKDVEDGGMITKDQILDKFPSNDRETQLYIYAGRSLGFIPKDALVEGDLLDKEEELSVNLSYEDQQLLAKLSSKDTPIYFASDSEDE